MKFLIIFIAITLIGNFNTRAQSNDDEIEIHKSFGGYRFYQNGHELKLNQLKIIMKSDEAANLDYKAGVLNNALAGILSISGGIMIGWQAGVAIANGDINWTLVGIGAGLVAVSIPFSIAGKKKLYSAVSIFNKNLEQSSSYNTNPFINISLSNNGIGIILVF